MIRRKLGSTDLLVSPLVLGCMSFGLPAQGGHLWTLDLDAGRPIFRLAVEAGINFFDTAGSYSSGSSEAQVGVYLKEFIPRDEAVLATKVFFPSGAGDSSLNPGVAGLSRNNIFSSLDASLLRMKLDYVDLYQIHRWDYTTPIEETMEALHYVVLAGKARYIGASSMFAWQFTKAQEIARANCWTPFVAMQNHYNLLYREEEREMMPLCRNQDIAVLPWSPLARGRLTRAWVDRTVRSRSDYVGAELYSGNEAADRVVLDSLLSVARSRNVSPAQVALAWLRGKPGVSAPIVGATSPSHVVEAVAALSLELSSAEIAVLESAYRPRPVTGHR